MASTKDRQRALERARYERVQAKIQKKRREAKRKQRIALVSSFATIAVIGGVVAGVLATSGSSSSKTTAAAATSSAGATSSSSSCTAASSISAETKGYHACGSAAKPGIGVPTYTAAGAVDHTVTITTNLGDIVFTADGKDAPYTVESFVYLVGKGYYDNTKCHRLTTSGIYVLQCGDPLGTGAGTPGYAFQDENLSSLGTANSSGTVTYKAGTVAMANAGYGTNGSQFFLVYKDSPLAPSYTPWGTITKGMDILQSVAAKGSNNANGTGDGAPKESVQIEKVAVS